MDAALRRAGLRPEAVEVEREVRSFASVEEGLAAAGGPQDRWKSDGRWYRYQRYPRGGRTDAHPQSPHRQGETAVSLASATLTEAVKARALELGFDDVAIGPAEPPEHGPALERWIEAGHAGAMGYLERRLGERLDPRRVLPGAASVVAVARELLPGRGRRSVVGARGALRLGPRLSRRDRAPARAARRVSRRGVRRAEPGLRRHGSRARARPRGAGGPRLDRQEHDAAPAGPRLVVLHRGAADHRRAGPRCAAAGSLRLVPRLPRRLPDERLRRALRARRPPLHLVSHHRASRRDRRRARVADGRVAVRLRPLPERLPVEQEGAGDGRGRCSRRRPRIRGRARCSR